jgi:N-acetylmuramoyl-L-alanine amidase
LQRRLTVLGFIHEGVEAGTYGPVTNAAVCAFQESRGLRVDGVCGDQTWSAVVEAGFRLGDRRLYQRKPMMRGDDIADLQRRLGELGFDAGKVDGIYGPDTAGALADFQRNAGLTADGIFGPRELAAFSRFGHRGTGGVAELRELASLSASSLQHLRVVVGERGGLDALATALGRTLRRSGATSLVLHHPSGSELAQQANAVAASLFVEVASLGAGSGCRCAYYQGYRTNSPAGQALASHIVTSVSHAVGIPDLGACGMALPALRETRMPAVMVEAGPTTVLVERAPAFVSAVTAAIATWVSV